MSSTRLRAATKQDVASLEGLIRTSARSLGLSDYTPSQIEAALGGAFGVDTELIRDGTYFLVEVEEAPIACGGWSRRAKPWGGDAHGGNESRLLDSRSEAAKIRAFFVHPDHARKGLASRLLEHCERAARDSGFTACELTATLPGVPFYLARGYEAGEPFVADLGSARIEFVPMRKAI